MFLEGDQEDQGPGAIWEEPEFPPPGPAADRPAHFHKEPFVVE